MLITTTDCLQEKTVDAYLGAVSSEVILGANFVKDFFANVRDVLGGRSGAYEQVIAKAKEEALHELTYRAQKLGANAIIGLRYNFLTIGAGGSMLMVSLAGTAVKIKP